MAGPQIANNLVTRHKPGMLPVYNHRGHPPQIASYGAGTDARQAEAEAEFHAVNHNFSVWQSYLKCGGAMALICIWLP